MPKLVVSLAFLALVIFPLCGWAGTADEQAITERIDAFTAAWNKADAPAMAACWTEDGSLINAVGRVANGREAVQTLFAEEHATLFKGTTYQPGQPTVQMIGDGAVAVADLDGTISNIKGANGKPAPDFKHHVVLVLVKKDATWMFAACRVFPSSQKPAPPRPRATTP